MCYKVKYPENFFLLRGNHEAAPINRIYGPLSPPLCRAPSSAALRPKLARASRLRLCFCAGFFDECKSRYSVAMWRLINEVFDCLPFTAVVEEKIFCVHAGLSPELQSLEQLKNIPRPTEIPDAGLICDLLWSDPEEGQQVTPQPLRNGCATAA